MASTFGRWLRIVVGLVLLVAGFTLGPWGALVCVAGVFFITMGAADVCLFAGMAGRSLNGGESRRARRK